VVTASGDPRGGAFRPRLVPSGAGSEADLPARCPTCGARRRGGETCSRCGTELSLLTRLEEDAAVLFEAALEAYARSDFERTARLCEESLRLLRAPRTWRLLAVAALRGGHYPQALRAARRAREALDPPLPQP
jgi:DNA-directed RNA polymerase subunit RPC12/RpoP